MKDSLSYKTKEVTVDLVKIVEKRVNKFKEIITDSQIIWMK